MIDLDAIKAIPDDKPRKGPARMSKSEKTLYPRRWVWRIRHTIREQNREPLRKSFVSVRWMDDEKRLAGIVLIRKDD